MNRYDDQSAPGPGADYWAKRRQREEKAEREGGIDGYPWNAETPEGTCGVCGRTLGYHDPGCPILDVDAVPAERTHRVSQPAGDLADELRAIADEMHAFLCVIQIADDSPHPYASVRGWRNRIRAAAARPTTARPAADEG